MVKSYVIDGGSYLHDRRISQTLFELAPLHSPEDSAISLKAFEPIVVGRVPSCTVQVSCSHPYVSGRHCLIVATCEWGIYIVDLSLNGIFINSNRIAQGKAVHAGAGDVITFCRRHKPGRLKFQVVALHQDRVRHDTVRISRGILIAALI